MALISRDPFDVKFSLMIGSFMQVESGYSTYSFKKGYLQLTYNVFSTIN